MRWGFCLLQKLLTKFLFFRLLPDFLRGCRGCWIFFVPIQARRQSRGLISSPPMKPKSKFKCLRCNVIHTADPRNLGRQCYCNKPHLTDLGLAFHPIQFICLTCSGGNRRASQPLGSTLATLVKIIANAPKTCHFLS